MSILVDVALAKECAQAAHDGQMYGSVPYIQHIFDVYNSLTGESDLVRVVALLHDIVEDTDWTHEMVHEKFGGAVGHYVELLTKDSSSLYIDDYIRIVGKSEIARKVKIADLHSNLSRNPTQHQRTKYILALFALGA